jgi:hypothetical protein
MPEEIAILQMELTERLSINETETNLLRRCENAVSILLPVLQQLRKLVKENESADTRFIISLHKQDIPPVYAEYIYYASLHNIESSKPFGNKQKEYYHQELKRVEDFFKTHADFLRYFKSGKTYLDETYFIPKSIKLGMYIDLYSPMMEDPFCTPYSFHAAMGIAYERLQQFLSKALHSYREADLHLPAIQWTASKTDLIELIYALHSSNAFDNGKITIRDITRFFEDVFTIQLGNTSVTFQEILRRKESTAFLDRLKDKLERHITLIDEKKFH